MADQDTDFGAFLVGFIVGGLVGAATALLLAPQSGEETRAYIRDKSIELKDRAAETIEDARARAEVALDDAKARADAAYADVKARTAELSKLTKQKEKVILEEQEAAEGSAKPAA